MKKFVVLFFVLSVSFSLWAANPSQREPVKIILETDIGNDVDDVLALDMLYKSMRSGEAELLAVCCHKKSDFAPRFVGIMNRWYGYPRIPVGLGAVCIANSEARDYTESVCTQTQDGKPLFSPRKHFRTEDAVTLYRRLLSREKDSSVVILSVGFFPTLARLLDSPPDRCSPLPGRELVARKVRYMSVMAGSFGPNARAEFNVVNDIASARKVFEEWPTPLFVSPFELGAKIQFPGSAIDERFDRDEKHPLVEAYRAYKPVHYNRAMWDPTAVVLALDPDTPLMTPSGPGTIRVDEKGFTHFIPSPGGLHVYYSVDATQAATLKKEMVDRIVTGIGTPENR